MKLTFDFSGIGERIVVSLFLSSSDSERPLGVISCFSVSNFNLGCRLFIVWYRCTLVVRGCFLEK